MALFVDTTPFRQAALRARPERPDVDWETGALSEAARQWPHLVEYISRLQDEARNRGVTLEVRDNFNEFLSVVDWLPERHPMQTVLDGHDSDVDPDDTLWAMGCDEQGDVVHLQAMRRLDLRDSTLDEHLGATINESDRGRGPTLERDRSGAASPTSSRRIAGWVCRHEQIWLGGNGGNGNDDGAGLTSILPRFLWAVALLKWSPDFVYTFSSQGLVEKGIPARYGYRHMQPGAIRWKVPPGQMAPDEWLAWSTREDLIQLTRPPTQH